MGKAYLELPEMPESCIKCKLSDFTVGCGGFEEMYCRILPVDDCNCPNDGRHPNCPLRQVGEGEKI